MSSFGSGFYESILPYKVVYRGCAAVPDDAKRSLAACNHMSALLLHKSNKIKVKMALSTSIYGIKGTNGKKGKKEKILLDLNTFNIMICQNVSHNLCFLSRMVDMETGSSKEGTHVVHAFDCKSAAVALELQKAITQAVHTVHGAIAAAEHQARQKAARLHQQANEILEQEARRTSIALMLEAIEEDAGGAETAGDAAARTAPPTSATAVDSASAGASSPPTSPLGSRPSEVDTLESNITRMLSVKGSSPLDAARQAVAEVESGGSGGGGGSIEGATPTATARSADGAGVDHDVAPATAMGGLGGGMLPTIAEEFDDEHPESDFLTKAEQVEAEHGKKVGTSAADLMQKAKDHAAMVAGRMKPSEEFTKMIGVHFMRHVKRTPSHRKVFQPSMSYKPKGGARGGV